MSGLCKVTFYMNTGIRAKPQWTKIDELLIFLQFALLYILWKRCHFRSDNVIKV